MKTYKVPNNTEVYSLIINDNNEYEHWGIPRATVISWVFTDLDIIKEIDGYSRGSKIKEPFYMVRLPKTILNSAHAFTPNAFVVAQCLIVEVV